MNEIRTQAVIAELELLPGWSRSDAALAELALTLARRLDNGGGAQTPQLAKELRATLGELDRLRIDRTPSKLDEITERHRSRRAVMAARHEAGGGDDAGGAA